MSALIKGMEMPSRRESCPFCSVVANDEPLCDLLVGELCLFGVACPLVPVPPHGDLISREWLIDIALHLMNTAKNDDIYNGVKWLWQYIIESTAIIEADRNLQYNSGNANNSQVIANNAAEDGET